jgi:integrase
MGVLELSPLAFSSENVMQKTWDDAVARWLIEKADKASLRSDLCIIRWLDRYLSGLPIAKITRPVVDSLAHEKISSGVANATVNRMLALLRSILIRASVDWEWLSIIPKVRLLREPVRRVRYITKLQAESLLLQLPPHLAEMTAFSLATGLRKSNVTGLCWAQVDLPRRVAWIHPDQSKTRKAIGIPLNTDAVRIITLQIGKHPLRVFSYNGQPIVQVTTAAWYKALKRCGIENFRWHDLRHTWASWHVQSGTPLNVLQELGGWESTEMVRRYAHFSASHLAKYAESLPELT